MCVVVQQQLSEHYRIERELVEALITYDDPGDLDGLARRMFNAENRGPTRPHPYLPHSGPFSVVAQPVSRRRPLLGQRSGTRGPGDGAPDVASTRQPAVPGSRG